MAAPLTLARLEQLRRAARRLERKESIPLYEAQDRLANKHGYANWSLMHKHCKAAATGATSAPPVPLTPLTPKPPTVVVGSRNRQYLHGDQHEADLTRFYCRSCDEFVAPEHFLEKHDRRETLRRALEALTRWHLPSNERAHMRPASAHNMLEDEARREAVIFQNSRSTFHRWLESRKGKDSPVGDLAADVLGDTKFPVDVQSVDEAISYLNSRFATEAAIKAMKQAWRQFEASQKRKA